jgi:hypothetical protein
MGHAYRIGQSLSVLFSTQSRNRRHADIVTAVDGQKRPRRKAAHALFQGGLCQYPSLEGLGLIKRSVSEDDRRRVREAIVTAKGKAMTGAVAACPCDPCGLEPA